MLDRLRHATNVLLGRTSPAALVRSYEGANGSVRRFGEGRSRFGTYSAETAAAQSAIQNRGRFFEANNPWAASGIAALTTASVGPGILSTSQHPNRETRRKIDAYVKRWAKRADLDARTDWFGLQAAALKAMFVDGEIFIQLVMTDDGLKLRLIPAEMVDASHTVELGNGRRIVAGIEFDADGRRVAYYISPSRPTDIYQHYAAPIRVPAEDVIHLFEPAGPGAVRGVSRLASVLLRLSELDLTEDAAQTAIKVSALLSVLLTNENEVSGDDPFTDAQSLEPGAMFKIPGGWKVTTTAPQQVQQVGEFLDHMLRSIAAGLGVPVWLVTGKISDANYGSQRGSLVAFRQRIEALLFHTVIPVFLQPIYDRLITSAILSGEIDADDFEANPDDWLAVEFIPPAQPWIDPLKDAEATERLIAARLMSRRQAVAGLGYSIEALDEEIAADAAREAELGLAPVPAKNDPKTPEAANAA